MRKAIPAETKLYVTLHFLASGESYTSLQYLFRIPKNSNSKFIPEMLDAIYDTLAEYTTIPYSAKQWKAIERGFAEKWNFPGCCGSIDRKHVIHGLMFSGSEYCNYKQNFSIVLFAMVDDNYCFRYVDIGVPGCLLYTSRCV